MRFHPLYSWTRVLKIDVEEASNVLFNAFNHNWNPSGEENRYIIHNKIARKGKDKFVTNSCDENIVLVQALTNNPRFTI